MRDDREDIRLRGYDWEDIRLRGYDWEDIRLRGYDWEGGDGWNVPWKRIEMLQAQGEEVMNRARALASWEYEHAVLRASRKERSWLFFAEDAEE